MASSKEGIYLEVKKAKIGTGVTASERVAKNYWLVRQAGAGEVKYLLTDDLELTGLREPVSAGGLDADHQYQPQLHERFLELLPRLGAGRPAAPKPPVPSPPAAKSDPAAIFAAPAKPAAPPKPAAPAKPAGEQPWWEATRKGADALLKK